MHELNVFALSISFYCKLAVYDFEPNSNKHTFYRTNVEVIKTYVLNETICDIREKL